MKILVPVDFSDASEKVLDLAIDYAKRLDAELVVLHVTVPTDEKISFAYGNEDISALGIPGGGFGYYVRYDVLRDQIAAELRAEHAQLLAIQHAIDPAIKSRAILIQSEVVEGILREADELSVDLIVMGSHGHGMLMRAILGSVSESVIQEGRFPVMVVPNKLTEEVDTEE
jgi:nucleotide-binding universal stress UspA family protein